MTTQRRSNSKSLPLAPDHDPARDTPVPHRDGDNAHEHAEDNEVIEVEVLPPDVTHAAELVPYERTVGYHANTAAAAHLLAEHVAGLSVSSRRQLGIVLKKWCAYLEAVGIQRTPENLLARPTAWSFVSWGLLQAYLQLMLNEGYATTTINLHLAMLRALVYIAHQAGGITDESEIQRIRTLRCYGARRGKISNGSVITFLRGLGLKKRNGLPSCRKTPTP